MALNFIEGLSHSGIEDFENNPFVQECLQRNNDLCFLKRSRLMALIGAGSIPSTLIKAWHLNLFEEYRAFDVDRQASEYGKSILDKLGLVGSYTCMSGEKVNYSEFDIIYVANLVQGKEKVLRVIFETCQNDAQVVIRLTNKKGHTDVDDFALKSIDEEKWKVMRVGKVSEEFKSYNVFLKKNNLN